MEVKTSTDYWSEKKLGVYEDIYTVKQLPPRSMQVIRGVPVERIQVFSL